MKDLYLVIKVEMYDRSWVEVDKFITSDVSEYNTEPCHKTGCYYKYNVESIRFIEKGSVTQQEEWTDTGDKLE